jgi:aspartate/methionine/tyrosine aminotransferase
MTSVGVSLVGVEWEGFRSGMSSYHCCKAMIRELASDLVTVERVPGGGVGFTLGDVGRALLTEKFDMFTLDEMANEAEAARDGTRVIRMTLGKSELPLHPEIIEAMEVALRNPALRNQVHPPGLPLLRETLAGVYNARREGHAPLTSSNFVVATGTSTVMRNLFQCLLEPEDEIVMPTPYYCMYKVNALIVRARIRHYTVGEEGKGVLEREIHRAVTPRCKILIINSPGNPLGNILSAEDILMIDTILHERTRGRGIILSDEIYQNVSWAPCTSVLDLKLKSRFIITDSCSKGYRMYTRRVGWCLIPHELRELVAPMTIMQEHTLLTTDPVAQQAAVAALRLPAEVQQLSELYRSRRDYTTQQLAPLVGFTPLGGFYICLDVTRILRLGNFPSVLELCKSIFRKTKVATVPGSDFGVPHLIRLSYTSAYYEEGIRRLRSYFDQWP